MAKYAGRMDVASMSIGGGASPSQDQAVESLIAGGVPVAAAAGNDNRDACYYSPARVPTVSSARLLLEFVHHNHIPHQLTSTFFFT